MGLQLDVMPALGGEAAEHQAAVQRDPIQALVDGEATAETDGLRHLNQTSSTDVQSQVQRDSENDPGPLQGQVNRQQAGQLVSLGQGGRALVDEPRHRGVPHVSQKHSSVGVQQNGH